MIRTNTITHKYCTKVQNNIKDTSIRVSINYFFSIFVSHGRVFPYHPNIIH